ncbi:DUF423 domain-containing protein [Psychroserpens burtonensis]|uniref:DUF423 domain-containing protein n=1 Tax=Psychroserpens burtonensis TaxID=49278 RepID=A0A5C7BBK2_9FLAO|nr:DUF423 domain-containing protein [Psychroserpens burtonensis]TXE19410.1 DUF423 domain-containing protein [Psychroserpens burtonensis]
MNKKNLVLGSLFGIIAIMLGAFGAHGLKSLITLEAIQTFEVGVRYQMYNALFLLFIGGFSPMSEKTKRIIFYLVLIGVLFFSGSLYALSINDITSFDFKAIGFMTPIGGLLLIIAWLLVLINFLKIDSDKS